MNTSQLKRRFANGMKPTRADWIELINLACKDQLINVDNYPRVGQVITRNFIQNNIIKYSYANCRMNSYKNTNGYPRCFLNDAVPTGSDFSELLDLITMNESQANYDNYTIRIQIPSEWYAAYWDSIAISLSGKDSISYLSRNVYKSEFAGNAHVYSTSIMVLLPLRFNTQMNATLSCNVHLLTNVTCDVRVNGVYTVSLPTRNSSSTVQTQTTAIYLCKPKNVSGLNNKTIAFEFH